MLGCEWNIKIYLSGIFHFIVAILLPSYILQKMLFQIGPPHHQFQLNLIFPSTIAPNKIYYFNIEQAAIKDGNIVFLEANNRPLQVKQIL